MPQAVIESVHAASSPGSASSVALAVDAGADERLLVFVDTRSTTFVVSDIDLGSLVFTQAAGPFLPGRSQHRLHVWEAAGTWSSGTLTVQLDGTTGGINVVVLRISGADPDTPWSGWTWQNTNGVSGAGTGGTDTATPTGSLTSTDTDQLHLVAAATRNRGLSTNPGDADYTRLAATFSGTGTGGSDVNLTLEYRDAAPGADTWASATPSAVIVDWVVVSVLINPAPAGVEYDDEGELPLGLSLSGEDDYTPPHTPGDVAGELHMEGEGTFGVVPGLEAVAGDVTLLGAGRMTFAGTVTPGETTAGEGGEPLPFVLTDPLWKWELTTWLGEPLAELQVKGRKVILSRRAPGSATFDMDLNDAGNLIDVLRLGEVDLRVSYQGAPIYGGPLTGGNVTLEPTSGRVVFGSVGQAAMLEGRQVPAGFTLEAIEQAQGAWNIVAQAQALGSLGIVAGALPDSLARTKTWDARTDCLRALNELADLEGGFDWSVVPTADGEPGPYRFDVYHPAQGADRGVSLEYGRNVRSAGLQLEAGAGALVNEWIAVGAGGVEVVSEDAASIARYRRRQGVLQLSDADDALVLGDAGRAELTRTAGLRALPRLTLAPGAPEATLGHMGIGDLVTVRLRRGWLRIDEVCRIEQLEVTLTDEGAESLVVITSPAGL